MYFEHVNDRELFVILTWIRIAVSASIYFGPAQQLQSQVIRNQTRQSPTMSCPDCFKGSVHNHAEPKGSMETLYGVSTYVSPAPEGSTSKSTILFICDAFGLNLINNVSHIS